MRIVVLGGGPAGYVAALRAAQLGADVTLVEAREIGGTCLNRGCIPTKAMVAGAARLQEARRGGEYGVELGDASRLDFAAFMARKEAVGRRSCATASRTCSRRARSRSWPVAAASPARGAWCSSPSRAMTAAAVPARRPRTRVEGDAVILASGSEPMRLPVFEIGDPRVMTSDELLQVDHIPESLLIVGGGVIGCEFAVGVRRARQPR